MQIYETLYRDPRTSSLANNGQARLNAASDDRATRELRAELETFVCDGEFERALDRILSDYLSHVAQPRQVAAWVSGFFGSGKSHLLKMLTHLWANTPFEDGATPRSLVHDLPKEIEANLRELDTLASRSGKPLVAASGPMPEGRSDQVRLTVLGILLRGCDMPTLYAPANFCLWLRDAGHLDRVRTSVEAAGKDWENELRNNLYASPVIAKAVLAADPNFASDERSARETIRQMFPNPTGDISTDELIHMAKRVLAPDGGELPYTILVLDEVQLFIGESDARSVGIQEVAEAICTKLDSRVLLVAAGQSALNATPYLQKLQDRFRIRVQLNDADVEAVTRKVLLRKKASAEDAVEACLDKHAGEVAKHLQGTKIAPRNTDDSIRVTDYPLLPARRRFWEACFRQFDKQGTYGQLRSQLHIIFDGLKKICDKPLGHVIPADHLYDMLAGDLARSGTLPNEIHSRIEELATDKTPEGDLRRRICATIFLIGALPQDQGVDLGVRSTAATIAELLLEDLGAGSATLRQRIEKQLEWLVANGKVMQIDDAFRMQTTEGAAWEAMYHEQYGRIRNREDEIAGERDQRFAGAVQEAVRTVKLSHGDAKIRRDITLHRGQQAPPPSTGDILVWLRDEWSVAKGEFTAAAQRAGAEDPTIHVLLPRKAADDLKSLIAEVKASQHVLDNKGAVQTREGEDARQSMQTRHKVAEAKLDALISDVMTAAIVLKGGGAEEHGVSLPQKIESAARASLARLFPEFKHADHRAWEAALKRAREGSGQPFGAVGWDKPAAEHPVVKETLRAVGAGATGTAVRKELEAPPFGWPRDAIDTALIALHRDGHLRASLNGQSLRPGELDQNKITRTEFRAESTQPLSAEQRLALKSLLQEANIPAKSGEEEAATLKFLSELIALARRAGGEAPLPAPPNTAAIEDMQTSSGNDLLWAVYNAKDALRQHLADWRAKADLVAKRRPAWDALKRLARNAEGLPEFASVKTEIDAIESGRRLLANPDPVEPLRKTLADALRKAVTATHKDLVEAHAAAEGSLTGDPAWQSLDAGERQALLTQHGLDAPPPPDLGTDELLINALDRQSLEARRNLLDALPARVDRAREEAAKKAQPKARTVKLLRTTVTTEAEVNEWVEEQRKRLLEELKTGPIIIA
jgi:hypothetical protein